MKLAPSAWCISHHQSAFYSENFLGFVEHQENSQASEMLWWQEMSFPAWSGSQFLLYARKRQGEKIHAWAIFGQECDHEGCSSHGETPSHKSLSVQAGPFQGGALLAGGTGASVWYLLITNCQLNASFVSLLGGSQLTQTCKRDRGVFSWLNDCVITSLPKHSSTIRAHHVLTA